MKRRDFLKNTAFVTAATTLGSCEIKTKVVEGTAANKGGLPIVISTWNHGIAANEAAMNVIKNGGRSLDAVEAGVSCLLYTSPSPRDRSLSRMPSSA